MMHFILIIVGFTKVINQISYVSVVNVTVT